MKKLIVTLILFVTLILLLPLLAFAQEVAFKLTPQATFVTENGEDFVVVPFEGKDAHQIYQTLASNVGSLFNDPSKVMSGVEDASIKVRAYCSTLCQKKVLLTFNGGGYYQLEFRIKDGRVRVSAPYVENQIAFDSQPISYGDFPTIVSKWYKKGELKDKNKKDVMLVELQLNATINGILGLGQNKNEEDW